MSMNRIYLDNNATTKIDDSVSKAMDYVEKHYENASSMHESGRRSRKMIEDARLSIKKLIGANEDDKLVFTSGGTESNNTVFHSMISAYKELGKNEVVISKIEHPSVIESAKELENYGLKIRFLDVDAEGRVDIARFEKILNKNTLLVSVMLANNEIGTIQDIKKIVKLSKKHQTLVHSDAVQALGKVRFSVEDLGVDYATFSAHKIHGPKGIGALFIRSDVPVSPLLFGGHQENCLRGGTYNTQAIYGFGEAAKIVTRDFNEDAVRIRRLRELLKEGICSRIPDVKINGSQDDSLDNTLSVTFWGAEGESMLLALDNEGVEVSTGSACAAFGTKPSHVLMAISNGDPEVAHGSIRFSLSKYNTKEEIERVLEILPPIIDRLRSFSTVRR